MIGKGSALGAITIINATATGTGCSIAIDEKTTATWQWRGDSLDWRGMTDDALARAIYARACGALGRQGAVVDCGSPFPPSRGLKTSSSAAIAMARAAYDASGVTPDEAMLEAMCIDAAIEAGVTLTGAFDDQVAVGRGGCHVTDNKARKILQSIEVPTRHVAIWVPQQVLPKSALKSVDVSNIADEITAATKLALAGDVGAALTANGAAYHRVYKAAGLPVDDAPARLALEYEALGAGLSGTGPAVAALFDQRLDLPAIQGGSWMWGLTVGVQA